ncbi:MAG: hypothetical protein ACI3XR_02940, partial [Eubacteriales bacterium]
VGIVVDNETSWEDSYIDVTVKGQEIIFVVAPTGWDDITADLTVEVTDIPEEVNYLEIGLNEDKAVSGEGSEYHVIATQPGRYTITGDGIVVGIVVDNETSWEDSYIDVTVKGQEIIFVVAPTGWDDITADLTVEVTDIPEEPVSGNDYTLALGESVDISADVGDTDETSALVTITAEDAGTLVIATAEGEENAWISLITDSGSEAVIFGSGSYEIEVAAGDVVTIAVSAYEGTDTVDLVATLESAEEPVTDEPDETTEVEYNIYIVEGTTFYDGTITLTDVDTGAIYNCETDTYFFMYGAAGGAELTGNKAVITLPVGHTFTVEVVLSDSEVTGKVLNTTTVTTNPEGSTDLTLSLRDEVETFNINATYSDWNTLTFVFTWDATISFIDEEGNEYVSTVSVDPDTATNIRTVELSAGKTYTVSWSGVKDGYEITTETVTPVSGETIFLDVEPIAD